MRPLGTHGIEALEEVEFSGKQFKISKLEVFPVAFELKQYIDAHNLTNRDTILVNGEEYSATGFFEICLHILSEDLDTAYYLIDGAQNGEL